mmetsp:Transcript_8897/g.18984  ORF Transcript_8897/g.18984 Transcript_8897/m.18984 type:complete len:910 (-) Transcript_8897:20-2749(-)
MPYEVPWLPPLIALPQLCYDRNSDEEQVLRKRCISEAVGGETTWPQSPGKADYVFGPDPCVLPKPQFAGHVPGTKQWRALAFSGTFESANLATATMTGHSYEEPTRARPGAGPYAPPEALQLEFHLVLDKDTGSNGFTQWFFFAARNAVPCTVKFTIVNLRKKKSMHSVGLQPHVLSTKSGTGWDPLTCQGVHYGPIGKKVGGKQFQALTFSYTFTSPEDEVFFSYFTPYTYTNLRRFVATAERHPGGRRHMHRSDLCQAICGAPVPLLLLSHNMGIEAAGDIREGKPPKTGEQCLAEGRLAKFRSKPAIVVIARQHPGETVGSWMCQGLVRFLLGSSPEAAALLDHFCFHIVPMVNVDGVVHGNSRCTLAGVDPNRQWGDPNPILHPVIHGLKSYVKKLSAHCSISAFFDLHGHTMKTGAFFYGCGASNISQALLPRIASLGSRDISFMNSRFKFAKAHNKTARAVVYNHCSVSASYTVECSFFGQQIPDNPNDLPLHIFNAFRVETIGCCIGRALCVYGRVDHQARAIAADRADRLPKLAKPGGGETPPKRDIKAMHLRPQAYPAMGCFDGTEELLCPYLTYQSLGAARADTVLADMQASGSTIEQLLNQEEGAGSDSCPSEDNDEKGKGRDLPGRRRSRDRRHLGEKKPSREKRLRGSSCAEGPSRPPRAPTPNRAELGRRSRNAARARADSAAAASDRESEASTAATSGGRSSTVSPVEPAPPCPAPRASAEERCRVPLPPAVNRDNTRIELDAPIPQQVFDFHSLARPARGRYTRSLSAKPSDSQFAEERRRSIDCPLLLASPTVAGAALSTAVMPKKSTPGSVSPDIAQLDCLSCLSPIMTKVPSDAVESPTLDDCLQHILFDRSPELPSRTTSKAPESRPEDPLPSGRGRISMAVRGLRKVR